MAKNLMFLYDGIGTALDWECGIDGYTVDTDGPIQVKNLRRAVKGDETVSRVKVVRAINYVMLVFSKKDTDIRNYILHQVQTLVKVLFNNRGWSIPTSWSWMDSMFIF